MNRSTSLLSALLMIAFAAPATAAEPSVDEIVERTNLAAYYAGEDGRAQVKMTITDSQGRTRVREFTVMRRDDPAKDGDGQRFYIHFHAPADVARTSFVVHKHLDRDDDRWLYLPGLDLIKRIAASDKRTSFVGSDFFYEDVSGRPVDADHHKLLRTTKSYFVLEHTPKNPSEVEFSRYEMFVHSKTFLPTKVTFFDKRGKKHREMKVDAVKRIGGHPTVTRATLKDHASGSQTVVEYKHVEYDVGLPAKIFTERYLRRPPARYLKASR